MIVFPTGRGARGLEKSKTPTNSIIDERPAQHMSNVEPKQTKETTASSVPSPFASTQPTNAAFLIDAPPNSPDGVRASPSPFRTVMGAVLFQPLVLLPHVPGGNVMLRIVSSETPEGLVGFVLVRGAHLHRMMFLMVPEMVPPVSA